MAGQSKISTDKGGHARAILVRSTSAIRLQSGLWREVSYPRLRTRGALVAA